MFQTIDEIKDFFNDRQKVGIKPGLERVTYMLESVGNPERQLQAVHVAGTNGKGSTIQFLKNALVANEFRVGLFTSPSFTGIRGHFLINNQEMTERELILCLNKLHPIIQKLDGQNMHPTEFEIMTVVAFLHFKNNVDIAIVETGMGGKYDTTNCFTPIVAIITNIARDHEAFLGNTIAEITSHKAGIIKKNRPVVVGQVNKTSENIIRQEGRKVHARVYLLHKDFTFDQHNNKNNFQYSNDFNVPFAVNMFGLHQIENASLAVMTLYLLEKSGLIINWDRVSQSIENTTLPGRFEVVHNRPTIVLDSAHNTAGIRAFLQTVNQTYKDKRKHLLFAAFKDKQIPEMIQQLQDDFQSIKLTTFDHDRAADLDLLSPFVTEETIEFHSDWEKVVQDILYNYHSEDVYFITGSLHFITLVRKFII